MSGLKLMENPSLFVLDKTSPLFSEERATQRQMESLETETVEGFFIVAKDEGRAFPSSNWGVFRILVDVQKLKLPQRIIRNTCRNIILLVLLQW